MKTIGIIGGNGGMGKLFTKVFGLQNLNVIIADKNTELDNKELVKKADYIMVSVPIAVTESVIEEIAPLLREDQILMDITSIKGPIVKKMLESKAEVIGLHPMFGPSVTSLRKQIIISVPARISKEHQTMVEEWFTNEGARIKNSTAEEHDRMMSVIQVLIHFHAMVLGNVLRKSNISIHESLEFLSPIYRLEFNIIARQFAQNPDLYGNIAMQNPHKEEILEHVLDETKHLMEIIRDNDIAAYRNSFTKTSEFLDDFTDSAMDESNELITFLQNS